MMMGLLVGGGGGDVLHGQVGGGCVYRGDV